MPASWYRIVKLETTIRAHGVDTDIFINQVVETCLSEKANINIILCLGIARSRSQSKAAAWRMALPASDSFAFVSSCDALAYSNISIALCADVKEFKPNCNSILS